jgi:CRISPR type I-E-associated protein CasA/Cse1
MNLVLDTWLPCRLADGSVQARNAAGALQRDAIEIAFARADLNHAATVFLVGLVQTAVVRSPSWIAGRREWEAALRSPVDLAEHLAQLAVAFDADKAFQCDVTGDRLDAGRLRPESPSDNAVKLNKDITVWRAAVEPSLTLPEGLAHLVQAQMLSLAWGGGFTEGVVPHASMFTLVVPDAPNAPLTETVLLNVLPYKRWAARFGEQPWRSDAIFPWLAGVPAEMVTPQTGHALAVYWGTPKAMRLVIEHDRVVGWARMKHKRQFQGFTHPMISYATDKQGALRPRRLRDVRLGYDHWAALTTQEQPAVLADLIEAGVDVPLRLRVFGWWSEQADAQAYIAAELPVTRLAEERRDRFATQVAAMVSEAEAARRKLFAVAASLVPKPMLGSLYLETEAAFYALVREAAVGNDVAAAWSGCLRRAKIKLFDEFTKGARLDLVEVARQRARL